MRRPAIASVGCCAVVRKPLRSPTSDAATRPAFVRSQSPLVSFHSSLHARPVSDPSAAEPSKREPGPNRSVCAFSLRSGESDPYHLPAEEPRSLGARQIVFLRCGLGRRERTRGIPYGSRCRSRTPDGQNLVQPACRLSQIRSLCFFLSLLKARPAHRFFARGFQNLVAAPPPGAGPTLHPLT